MNPDLITAAVLAAPAALLGSAASVATLRQRPHDRARAAILADLRAARTAEGPDEDPTPPDGGQPTPAPAEAAPAVRLAPVIPLPTRPAVPLRPARRAA